MTNLESRLISVLAAHKIREGMTDENAVAEVIRENASQHFAADDKDIQHIREQAAIHALLATKETTTAWTPTTWVRQADLDAFAGGAIEIHRCVSPHYSSERYAARRGSSCLAKDGTWEYEPLPSGRDDVFYERCRFATFDEAAKAVESFMASPSTSR